MPFLARLMRWLIALLLLPLVAAAGLTLFSLFQVLWNSGEWQHPWCWAFGAGLAAWFLLYALLPKPMWVYVFGHELTHALAVYLHAGRVHRFHVSTRGGHIISDRSNWIIALAPYFIPLYSLLLIGLWWTVDFYYPLTDYTLWFYAGLGLTWGFHLTFTVSMIGAGQSDLTSQDVFFSLVLIVLLNLLLIECGMLAVLHSVTLGKFFGLLGHNIASAYGTAAEWLWKALDAAVSFISSLLAKNPPNPSR